VRPVVQPKPDQNRKATNQAMRSPANFSNYPPTPAPCDSEKDTMHNCSGAASTGPDALSRSVLPSARRRQEDCAAVVPLHVQRPLQVKSSVWSITAVRSPRRDSHTAAKSPIPLPIPRWEERIRIRDADNDAESRHFLGSGVRPPGLGTALPLPGSAEFDCASWRYTSKCAPFRKPVY
jgi:hypothetical protein